jgi:hypothetical protein
MGEKEVEAIKIVRVLDHLRIEVQNLFEISFLE